MFLNRLDHQSFPDITIRLDEINQIKFYAQNNYERMFPSPQKSQPTDLCNSSPKLDARKLIRGLLHRTYSKTEPITTKNSTFDSFSDSTSS